MNTPQRKQNRKLFTISFLTIIVIFSIAACTSIPVKETKPSATEETTQAEEIQQTLITFTVNVPANTPADDTVLISVLDEVTGLALNAVHYPMEKVDNHQYSIQLPFKVGSVIKYRYSRQGNMLSEEHTYMGEPVRYRMILVNSPAQINDIVSRWTDTPPEEGTGRVSGVVTNADTGQPLPGILIAFGGIQTFTDANGAFSLYGLPPGTQNLVAYAIDGSYQPYQQGALVAVNSNTPVQISLDPATFVDVAFLVKVPPDMVPAVPLRLAGNLYQLGNTFSNLSGGINGLVDRMPVLSPLPDGRYGIMLSLPVGTEIKYKYTLGDGFWNAEQQVNQPFVIRSFIVSDSSTVIEDEIYSFNTSDFAPITFDITVPELTPVDEQIYIQFNPYGWTEPIPMWKIGERRWAYILNSPLQTMEKFGVRFCRQGQCGYADDYRTIGDYTSGKIIHPQQDPITIQDTIETWAWLEDTGKFKIPNEPKVTQRPNFVQAIELQPRYQADWGPILPRTFEHIASLGTNTVIFSPNWTFAENTFPTLSSHPENSMNWLELTSAIQQAQAKNLNVAIKLTPQFPTNPEDWWINAPRDFSWWVTWFDQYEAFILHHAKLAEMYQVNMLIIGSDTVTPALPNGKLADGTSSNAPPDAEKRWEDLLNKIQKVYSGKIIWDISYPNGLQSPPAFLEHVDQLYLQFDAALADDKDASINQLRDSATIILENEVLPFWLSWTPKVPSQTNNLTNTISTKEPILFAVSYPSADGGITGCLEDPVSECIKPQDLNFPAPDFPLIALDLEEQADVYHALLTVINRYNWIGGFVSQGYYPPAILQDKSTSIHGKPAETILEYWFHRINP